MIKRWKRLACSDKKIDAIFLIFFCIWYREMGLSLGVTGGGRVYLHLLTPLNASSAMGLSEGSGYLRNSTGYLLSCCETVTPKCNRCDSFLRNWHHFIWKKGKAFEKKLMWVDLKFFNIWKPIFWDVEVYQRWWNLFCLNDNWI